jgi:hypothetical protein
MFNLKLKTLEFIKKCIDEKSFIEEIQFNESGEVIQVLPKKQRTRTIRIFRS